MHSILIADDEPAIRRRLEQMMRDRGHAAESVASGEAALEWVRGRRPELVLLDVQMGGIDGLETLRRLQRDAPRVPVVIMTGTGTTEIVVRAFKLGAVDFVTKPFDLPRLFSAVDAILAPRADGIAPALIGGSARFREAMDAARRFALPDINVLLEGETGTGKELFARTIHAASKRRDGPFVPVDCSLFSESLIESELFGHEKGAFTGAVSSRIGHFERANGGTLFLDEIGNLLPPVQAKLLRVLQERTLERVGGRETIHLDIRVVSATNVNLRDASRAGQFRSDLYYRLAEVTVAPPPLRERAGDVALLAAHFVKRYAAQYRVAVSGLSDAALARLAAYAFPGNVRELESAIKAAVIRCDGVIGPEHLELDDGGAVSVERRQAPAAPQGASAEASRDRVHIEIDLGGDGSELDLKALGNEALEKAERAVIAAVMARGAVSRAQLGRLLKVDEKTLRAKLKKYGLDGGGS